MPLSDRESRVCDLIRQREAALLDDLRLHVALPTGGGNRVALTETLDRFAARLNALGADTSLCPSVPRPSWLFGEQSSDPPLLTHVFHRCGAYPLTREILLAGHIDTVHDPRGPFRELTVASDGRTATGPGCVDMKGGLVIGLAALEALDEVGARFDWTVILNSDEETGSYHSARAIGSEAARVAARGGLGIALEPATADGGLVVERAGSAQFVIEVQGKPAHVGRDFASGVSAVHTLAQIILEVSAMGDPPAGLIVNIGPLRGGTATNVVPDSAAAWGNARFSNAELGDRFVHSLKALDGPRKNGAIISTRCSFGRPAKPMTPEVERFAELVWNCAADLNQPLPLSKTAGVCDGNLMQAAGLPTLDTLGVRGGGLHTPQEWIDLSSLVERCQLLAITMIRASTRPG